MNPLPSQPRDATPDHLPLLSAREEQVLRHVVNGDTNEEIAQALFLNVNSVKTYIRGAYRKIGVATRPEAILWGVCHDLLDDATVRRYRRLDGSPLWPPHEGARLRVG